ncbi:tetratricopeptide repeat protein [Actinosynnema sp. NPDC023587]|uniref:tetratricopeptide repeat protein n=1 Tax=Actinosynnema sp. NPDC023587 TaxID=3154695 RepID=UPI0034108062
MSEQGRRLLRDVLRARHVLGHDVPDPGPPNGPLPLEDADDVRRWFAEHRDDVVAAIRVGDDTAVELLAHAWHALPADVDGRWPLELYDRAAPLAAALPASGPLAAAFRAGAEVLRGRGSLRPAAALGMRELAVWRHLDDPEPTVDALHALAATYRAQGRLHRVVGCADEVLELRVRHGDQDAVARALTDLGSLMIEADRLGTAVNYLTRAVKACEGGGPVPDRARAQVLLGRALWLSGDEGAGRRWLRRVLPDLADDDARAVRELLDLPVGAPPGSVPEQGHQERGQRAERGLRP